MYEEFKIFTKNVQIHFKQHCSEFRNKDPQNVYHLCYLTIYINFNLCTHY